MESGGRGYLGNVDDTGGDGRHDLTVPATRPTMSRGDAGFARRGKTAATTASIVGPNGFDKEMEVLVPAREATFLTRIAGIELAESRGVVLALHGVRAYVRTAVAVHTR